MKESSKKRARQEASDESIASDDFVDEEIESTTESQDEPKTPFISVEEQRLLLAQQYLDKLGLRYDDAGDLGAVVKSLGVDDFNIRTREIAKSTTIEKPLVFVARKQISTCVEVNDDDTSLFAGGKDSSIIAWDIETQQQLWKKDKAHHMAIYGMCSAMGGRLLCTVGKDCAVKVWDVRTTDLVHSFAGHTKPVTCVRALGDVIYTGSADKSVREWSLIQKSCLQTHYGHTQRICCIDSVQKDFVLTGGEDATTRYWTLKLHKHALFEESCTNLDSCALLNKHGFLSGGSDGYINLWSIGRKKALARIATGESWVTSIAVCPNSDLAFSTNTKGQLFTWFVSMANQGQLENIGKMTLNGIPNDIKVSRSGRYLAAATAVEGKLGRWNISKDAYVGGVIIPLIHEHIGLLYDD